MQNITLSVFLPASLKSSSFTFAIETLNEKK